MRFLIRFFLILIVLAVIAYTFAWFFASTQVRERLAAAAEQTRGTDQTLSFDTVEVTGFPFNFQVQLNNLVVQDFKESVKWQAPSQISGGVSVFKPLTITADIGGTHTLGPADGSANSGSGQSRVSIDVQAETLSVTAGLDQHIKAIKIDIPSLTLSNDQLGAVQIDQLKFDLNPPTELGSAYEASIARIQPQEPFNVMGEMSNIRSTGVILPQLPKTPKQHHMRAWQRAGGDILIENFTAEVAPAVFDGDGSISLSSDLQPTVNINAYAKNVEALIDRAIDLGFVTPDQSNIVRMGTMMFARPARDGAGRELVLPIKVNDGQVVFGPFNLFKLPKVNWPR